jgi:hypothetical protein
MRRRSATLEAETVEELLAKSIEQLNAKPSPMKSHSKKKKLSILNIKHSKGHKEEDLIIMDSIKESDEPEESPIKLKAQTHMFHGSEQQAEENPSGITEFRLKLVDCEKDEGQNSLTMSI